MEIIEKKMAQLVELMEEPLANGSEVAFTVRGNSMWPLLHDRKDKIFLKRLDFYKTYDIILYKRDDKTFVLHRIVGKKNGAFYLAGDGEFEKEYPIYPEQILAKAVRGVRYGKPFSCSSFGFKAYSVLWVFLLPVRPLAVRVFSTLRRWGRNVFAK